MDAEPHRQPLAPNLPKEIRRWNYEEENELIYLIKVEKKTYKEAAIALNRSTKSVQHRYSTIRQRDESAAIIWTSELDAAIIDGRRRMLTTKQIAQEINMPDKAILSRWQALQAMKRVPEDVLASWRHKELREFTPQEDEAILRLYVEGKNDKEIALKVKIIGKSQTDILKRRQKLVAESSPIYRRLMGMWHETWDDDGTKEEIGALGMAVGRAKYEWMNEGDSGSDTALD